MIASARRVGRLAHQRRMRRHADGQLDGLARAALGQPRERRVDRLHMATDDDLARRVVVGRRDDVLARHFATNLLDHRIVGSEHRRHCADAFGRRFLHRLTADAHQMRGVAQGNHASGDEGGVFAEAVACQLRRHRPSLHQPDAPHGDTRREQRRLRVFGAIEHRLGSALRQRQRSTPAPSEASAKVSRTPACSSDNSAACQGIASPGRGRRRRAPGIGNGDGGWGSSLIAVRSCRGWGETRRPKVDSGVLPIPDSPFPTLNT